MIPSHTREMVHALLDQGVALREVSRLLRLSRNTVRRIRRTPAPSRPSEAPACDADTLEALRAAFTRCAGNVVRVHEALGAEHHIEVPYSTLTRWVREAGLRAPRRRAGEYHFAPGEEMQHDTSPHRVRVAGTWRTLQCAALVLAFCRRLFIAYYPRFTRFEAKAFLADALAFHDGACTRCVIDNSSIIVAAGTGPDATIAPEMVAFARAYGFTFTAHALGHAARSARVERPFYYVERNFLAGRTFDDLDDLNTQALAWCVAVANRKPKRSLGRSPEAAYLLEKPELGPLPPCPPPVYECFERIVDVVGYASLDTNRYSVPEHLVGARVTVYKHPTEVRLFHRGQCVASHPRLLGEREARSTLPGHHTTPQRHVRRREACTEELALRGRDERLDRYLAALKSRSRGRGQRALRRLLELQRTYPAEPFLAALEQALHYGLFDLARLEQLILRRVAGDFFSLNTDGDTEHTP